MGADGRIPVNGQQVGPALGLGAAWQPGPAGWRWADVTTADGQRWHVLIIETMGGTQAIALGDEALERLGAQITERTGGLTVPRPQIVWPKPDGRG